MITSPATYIFTPSTEQLEEAWWKLMNGALELDTNPRDKEFFQIMLDYVKDASERGVPLIEPDGSGEPLTAASSEEMARRLVRAFASLFYGI